MAMTSVVVASLLTFILYLQHVEGQEVCRIKFPGKLQAFSRAKLNIRAPCKYEALNLECEGYKVKVVPGQSFDKKFRYYTRTAWISIAKKGTEFYWKGRTSNGRVKKYFKDPLTRTAFKKKQDSLQGASFNVVQSADEDEFSVTLGVTDADFRITFYGYNPRVKQIRKRSGIEFTCPENAYNFRSDYPRSLCGNGTDSRALRNRKKELGFGSKVRTLLYDILDNERIVQMNPHCEIATMVFKACPVDRVQVINDCQKILTHNRTIKCLGKFGLNPMTAFIYCLKYKCNNDADSCDLLQEALDGCPSVAALPAGTTCPDNGAP